MALSVTEEDRKKAGCLIKVLEQAPQKGYLSQELKSVTKLHL